MLVYIQAVTTANEKLYLNFSEFIVIKKPTEGNSEEHPFLS